MKKLVLLLLNTCLLTFSLKAESTIDYQLEESDKEYVRLHIHFMDGATSDRGKHGLTSALFKAYLWGSIRYQEDELYNHLDFFGGDFKSVVSRQRSDIYISGMKLDLVPKVKKMCHMFARSSFSKKIVQIKISALNKYLSDFEKEDTSKFDRLTLKRAFNDDYLIVPIEGLSKTVRKIKAHHLEAHSAYFNNRVKKKISFKGPKKSFEELKIVLKNECRWGKTSENVEKTEYALNFSAPKKNSFFVSDRVKKPIIRISAIIGEKLVRPKEISSYIQHIIDHKAVPTRLVEQKKLLKNFISLDYEIAAENVIAFIQALGEGVDSVQSTQFKNIIPGDFSITIMGKNNDLRKMKKSGLDLETLKIRL